MICLYDRFLFLLIISILLALKKPNHKYHTAPNVQSLSTLLDIPVHQLVNANIESANHVAATKCIKTCRHGQEVQQFSDQMSELRRNVIFVILTME